MAKKDDVVIVEGVVLEVLPASQCRVQIGDESNGIPTRSVIAYLSGKMKKHFIKIIPGDKVKVELSIYDLTKGRIIFRETNTALKNAA